MKALLIVKSALETPTGLLLLVSPSTLVWLLLGLPLVARWLMAARLVGAVLLALGGACWLVRNRPESHVSRRLIFGLLAYDFAVVAVLLIAQFGMSVSGMLLWPAILLHTGLALWSLLERRKAHSWLGSVKLDNSHTAR